MGTDVLMKTEVGSPTKKPQGRLLKLPIDHPHAPWSSHSHQGNGHTPTKAAFAGRNGSQDKDISISVGMAHDKNGKALVIL